MKLLNGYKLLYSAVRDNKLGLYASKALPSLDDEKLTFVNKDGQELTDEELKAIKLVYVKEGSLCYSFRNIPTNEDRDVFVYLDGELVFGDEKSAPEEANWLLIKDEASWNAAYADENSALNKYYAWSDVANAPYKEDLWNTVANRAANINDARKVDGEYVLDENGNYIYDNCERCWKGAVNAPGAAYPWAVVAPSIPFEGKIRFVYKDGEAVYPWGEKDKVFSRGFAIASIPNELGMPELKVNEAGEAELAIEKEDLAITLLKK